MAEDTVSTIEPIEFYKFADTSQEWRFTDYYTFATYAGQQYSPLVITRGSTEEALQDEKQNIEVKMPVSENFVQNYNLRSNSSYINCSIFRRANGVDTLIYIGKVTNVKANANEATITVSNLASDLLAPAGGIPNQIDCPYFLYDDNCRVARASFKITGTVTSATTTTLTATVFGTKPDDWMTGGLIEINNQNVAVSGHTGTTVNLYTPINFDATGLFFNAFAGCDRSMATCNTKFSNIVNHGGAPYTPSKNPFKGDAITT